jgi:hypothetical protein
MMRTKCSRLRLGSSALVLATAAGLATFVGSVPAHADTVSVNYSCQVPLSGTQSGAVEVTIEAPATAVVGDTVGITVTSSVSPVTTPLRLNRGDLTASGTVAVSGAQTGTVQVTGQPNTAPIPAGTRVQLPPMTGKLTLTGAGQVDLTPGTATAVARTFFGTFTIPCTPTSPPGVAASIQVS